MMHVNVLSGWSTGHYMHAWGPVRSDEGAGASGSGVTDGCEPGESPYMCLYGSVLCTLECIQEPTEA